MVMGLAAFNRRRRELAAAKVAEAVARQAREERKATAQPSQRQRKDRDGDKDGADQSN